MTDNPYADLRKMLTELNVARKRAVKARDEAGGPAAERNRKAFEELRGKTLELARTVLARDAGAD